MTTDHLLCAVHGDTLRLPCQRITLKCVHSIQLRKPVFWFDRSDRLVVLRDASDGVLPVYESALPESYFVVFAVWRRVELNNPVPAPGLAYACNSRFHASAASIASSYGNAPHERWLGRGL